MLSTGNEKRFKKGKDDKKRLNEYQVQAHPAKDGKPSYTECFLETIDGPISIHIRKTSKLDITSDWQSRCSIDGVKLSGSVWRTNKTRHSWRRILQKDDEGTAVYDLSFAPLPTTDDKASVTLQPSDLQKLGNIEINLRRGSYTCSGQSENRAVALKEGIADERAKKLAFTIKGINRRNEKLPIEKQYDFTPFDSDGRIYHRFVFRYRPRFELIRMRIIDEPLSCASQNSATQTKRRQSSCSTADIVSSTRNGQDQEDVKPETNAKRIRRLEEYTRELLAENKRLRSGRQGKDEPIDLSIKED